MKRAKRNRRALLLLTCLSLLGGGCSNNTVVYSSFVALGSSQWGANDSLLFHPMGGSPLSSDSLSLTIYLRHTNDYPYRDIWLYTAYTDSLGTLLVRDTIHFPTTDRYGKWLGRGFGSLHLLEIPTHHTLPLSGDSLPYQIVLQHAMTDSLLSGITEVGITIK